MMNQLSAFQFAWTLIKRTRRLPLIQRFVLIGAGIIIYGSFYVSANRPPAEKPPLPDGSSKSKRLNS